MATLGERIASMEATMVGFKETLDNHTTTLTETVQDHEKRIRKGEVWWAYLIGAATVAGSIAGVVGGILLRVIGG